MKRLLLVSLLIGTNSILAMEAPEPIELGTKEVTLVSAQGKEFVLPASAALRSATIANMLGRGEFQTVEAQSNRISFAEISSSTLDLLIPMLERLDQLLSQNDQADQMNTIYIPRRYQPFVNQRLKDLSNSEIAALYQAADFLDVPFIINAVAAVIADRIEGKIDTKQWENLKAFQREDLINERAAQLGIRVKQEYILKQVTFRKSGITQEYSIADYIAEHGQLQLDDQNRLRLSNKKLTSLFGIDRLHARALCQILGLSRNCFFDIALDVQSVPMPFQGFAQLQELDLILNQLNNLPEHVFDGLAQLRRLSLGENQLSTLPEHVFDDLVQLQELHLNHNQLSTLPEHVFAGLAELQTLSLGANQLSNLPEHVFAGLAELQTISLYSNQLNNLPEQIFAELTELRRLYLNDNQLSNLPEHVFAGLAALRDLNLKSNQLSEQEKQRIKEQLPNTRIRFD